MRKGRPDIALSVGVVSRCMHNPPFKHWSAAKRILRYLKKYPSLPIHYHPTKSGDKFVVSAFFNADWAGDVDSQRSTVGYGILVNGRLISWSSKLLDSVTLTQSITQMIILQ